MDRGPIQIACASDARYLPHVATLMESLAASNPSQSLTLHLLHDDTVTPELLQQLGGAAQRLGLTFAAIRPTDDLLDRLPPSSGFYPSLIWYRILLPELLGTHNLVLYLDADTLVLQDLRAIWSTDLADALMAAVAQPENDKHSVSALARMGLPKGSGYFNSGVLLMDLRRMREERFCRWVTDVARAQAEQWADSRHFRLPDQDALNFVCSGRWVELHPKWNCLAMRFLSRRMEDSMDSALTVSEAVASPAILHFEGSGFAKPWNYRCVHPLRHLYLMYRKSTPWPLETLEGAHLAARILRPLPPRVQLKVSRLKPRALRIGS